MAPLLSLTELDLIVKCLGKRQSLKEIHEVIKLEREWRGTEPPKISETRGGKYKLSEAPPVILAWLVVCLAAGGPHPDGHLKLVASVVMPGPGRLHFPMFRHIF